MKTAPRFCVLALLLAGSSGCVRAHGGDGGFSNGGVSGAGAGSGGASSDLRGSGSGGSGGTAPSAGQAGTSANPARAGAGAVTGTAGMAVAGSPSEEASCVERARVNAGMTLLDEACFACTCEMKASATNACDGTCWKLIECVLMSGCASTDPACIVEACARSVGGAERFNAAARLVVAVPIAGCRRECSISL
jgi:hypothetical protein